MDALVAFILNYTEKWQDTTVLYTRYTATLIGYANKFPDHRITCSGSSAFHVDIEPCRRTRSTCAATATPGCICVRWRCCACCRIVDMEYVIVCVLCQVKSQHFTRQTQRMGEYKCNAYVLCQCLLHKVHRHLNLPCSQIPLPPQSAHLLFCLPCMQRALPPQSEHQCRCLL